MVSSDKGTHTRVLKEKKGRHHSQCGRDNKENSDQKELISININGENRFFLGDRAVNFEELKLEILALDKKQNIEIRSDENASFGSFIRLIDLLKINNYENFQIAVKKK